LKQRRKAPPFQVLLFICFYLSLFGSVSYPGDFFNKLRNIFMILFVLNNLGILCQLLYRVLQKFQKPYILQGETKKLAATIVAASRKGLTS